MGGARGSAKTATVRAASRRGVDQVMRASSPSASTTNNRDELRQPPENAEHLQHVNVTKIAAVGPDFGAVGDPANSVPSSGHC